MQSILDLLNRIKWDDRLNPEEYSIHYLDRISKGLIEIRFTNIKRIEGGFIIIDNNEQENHIPLHRIKKVRRNNKLVWERKYDN